MKAETYQMINPAVLIKLMNQPNTVAGVAVPQFR
jgi:hypothetical protein